MGQRETERTGNKSKGERERVRARGARKGASGTGDSSGARKWCDARAPKRRSAPAAVAAAAAATAPPPGSAFRISSRSVLGGFSQSADAPRNAVIISIVCSPFSEGGEEGGLPTAFAFHLSPSSIFRITPSLLLPLRSRSRASMSRAMPVQPPCASFSPPLTRTH